MAAGPYATQFLAQLGAEVIKIEPPGTGDTARAVGPHFLRPGESVYFQTFNLNKRSLTLDLRKPEGPGDPPPPGRESHAVANNMRGDLPAKLGLTFDALKTVNPGARVRPSLRLWPRQ
jgi:crotonobetainyl-CoA:carnitine CoA-transferase CaiB-like acyl-CoA transferase